MQFYKKYIAETMSSLAAVISGKDKGITLVELLIVVAIMGILAGGIQQIIARGITTYKAIEAKQELITQAQFALGRMLMFIQSSDGIAKPDSASNQDEIIVSDRIIDNYDNITNAYLIDGDGILDANNDNDDLVNEDVITPDPSDMIIFDLDKTDPNNWKLQEKMPDYSTPDLADYVPAKVLCEKVSAFSANLVRKNDFEFFANLVEMQLTLSDGTNKIRVKTRAKASRIE